MAHPASPPIRSRRARAPPPPPRSAAAFDTPGACSAGASVVGLSTRARSPRATVLVGGGESRRSGAADSDNTTRLHQHVTTVTVPRFRDRPLPLPRSTRVLAGDESEVCGELARPLEAPPIADLRREHHGRAEPDPAEALQAPHRGSSVGSKASCSISRSSASRRCSLYASSA